MDEAPRRGPADPDEDIEDIQEVAATAVVVLQQSAMIGEVSREKTNAQFDGELIVRIA